MAENASYGAIPQEEGGAVNVKELKSPLQITEKEKSTSFQTFLNLFKSFIGLGILAAGEAFGKVGIWGGVLAMALIGIINSYTIVLQVHMKNDIGDYVISYSTLGYAVHGKRGKAFIDTFMMIAQFGFCISYILFVGKQFSLVFNYLETGTASTTRLETAAWILLALAILIPFAWMKNLKLVSYFSFVANIALILCLVSIIVYDIQSLTCTGDYSSKDHCDHVHIINLKTNKNEWVPREAVPGFDLGNFPLFFGIALFNFEGNTVVLNMQGEMAKPKEMYFVVILTVVVVLINIYVIAILSLYAYSTDIQGIVLFNLPNGAWPIFIKIFYAVSIMASYIIQLYPILNIIELSSWWKSQTCFGSEDARQKVMRAGLVAFTALIASMIPDINLFMNFSGCLTGSALAFIAPALLHNSWFKDRNSSIIKGLNWFIVVFGFVVGGYSVVIAFDQLVSSIF